MVSELAADELLACALVATESVLPAVGRYAATVMSDFTGAELGTVTVEPASPAVAVRDQTVPSRPSAEAVWTWVQPAGAVTVAVEEFVVRNRSRASPGWTPEGICTEWTERLPAELVAATKLAPAWVALTLLVTVAVPPSLSVTVRVTSRVPAVA